MRATRRSAHLIALLLTAATARQAIPIRAQESIAACQAIVNATNDRGLERIEITSPCRRNETVRASYGTLEQQVVFSDDGVATLAVAITADRSPIILIYRDETTTEVSVDPSVLATVFRITLQWEAPVDLNLHVVEPGGVLGGKGDATAGHSQAEFHVRGRLDLEGDGTGVSPFQESYVFPNRQDKPSDIFTVYVENVTRGRVPSRDNCGQGQYAQIRVKLIVADRGRIRTNTSYLLASAKCNETLQHGEYYIKLPF